LVETLTGFMVPPGVRNPHGRNQRSGKRAVRGEEGGPPGPAATPLGARSDKGGGRGPGTAAALTGRSHTSAWQAHPWLEERGSVHPPSLAVGVWTLPRFRDHQEQPSRSRPRAFRAD